MQGYRVGVREVFYGEASDQCQLLLIVSVYHLSLQELQLNHMQAQLELPRKYFPPLSSKQQSVGTVFQLIKLKKVELTKQIEEMEGVDNILPVLSADPKIKTIENNDMNGNESVRVREEVKVGDEELRQSRKEQSRYKTILEKTLHQNNFKHHYQLESILPRGDKRERINPHNSEQEGKGFKNRTITQVRQVENRKNTNSSHINSAVQKIRDEEQKSRVIEEAKVLFAEAIQKIPKNVKMRSEDNLSETLIYLQAFNPFFNRVQRIISICLLKMGKIVYRESQVQLYKANEELEYFYIILLGKVRLSDGSGMRRVCNTGQVVLQQTLFSQKYKKVSLEKAKVISASYLLEMKIDQYKKMKQQLIRYGFKVGFQQMQAILKRNYIIKNWMRNKQKEK